MRFKLFLLSPLFIFSCFAMEPDKGKEPADTTMGKTIVKHTRTFPVQFSISRSERVSSPEDPTGPFIHIVELHIACNGAAPTQGNTTLRGIIVPRHTGGLASMLSMQIDGAATYAAAPAGSIDEQHYNVILTDKYAMVDGIMVSRKLFDDLENARVSPLIIMKGIDGFRDLTPFHPIEQIDRILPTPVAYAVVPDELLQANWYISQGLLLQARNPLTLAQIEPPLFREWRNKATEEARLAMSPIEYKSANRIHTQIGFEVIVLIAINTIKLATKTTPAVKEEKQYTLWRERALRANTTKKIHESIKDVVDLCEYECTHFADQASLSALTVMSECIDSCRNFLQSSKAEKIIANQQDIDAMLYKTQDLLQQVNSAKYMREKHLSNVIYEATKRFQQLSLEELRKHQELIATDLLKIQKRLISDADKNKPLNLERRPVGLVDRLSWFIDRFEHAQTQAASYGNSYKFVAAIRNFLTSQNEEYWIRERDDSKRDLIFIKKQLIKTQADYELMQARYDSICQIIEEKTQAAPGQANTQDSKTCYKGYLLSRTTWSKSERDAFEAGKQEASFTEQKSHLLEQFNALNQSQEEHGELSTIEEDRIAALEQTLNEQGMCYDCTLTCSEDVQRLITNKGSNIDEFSACKFNAYQCELAFEGMDIINQALDTKITCTNDPNLQLSAPVVHSLLDAAIDMALLAHEANKYTSLKLAEGLLGTARLTVDICCGATEGIQEGIVELADQIATDPIGTVKRITLGTWHNFCFAAKGLGSSIAFLARQDARMKLMQEFGIHGHQEAAQDAYDQFIEENRVLTSAFNQVVTQIEQEIGSLTARDAARQASKFITQTYLEGKTCSILFGLFNRMGNRASRWLQDCKAHLTPQQIEELFAATPEGFELKLAHDTFDELNFQTMAAKDAMSGAPQINTIRDVEIYNPAELAALEAKWLTEFKSGPKHARIPQYPQSLRPEHVFGIEYYGKQLPDGTRKISDWQGFHHDIGRTFEQQGLIHVPRYKIHQYDIVEADIIYKGILHTKTKFHPNWTRDDIMQNVLEAYRNPAAQVTSKPGRLIINSFAKSGQPIRIVTNNTGERFISFYPPKITKG